MSQKPVGRSYEKRFEVAAPLEAVWKAITEGEELTRWLCQSASAEPDVGGTQMVDWGGGAVGTSTITVWEPGVHLRTEAKRPDMPHASMPDPPQPYALDWYLEHAHGVTKVRMVASGFGEGTAWDHEYDGTFHGWDLFHNNMKHYLEHHRGQHSVNVVLYAVLPAPLEDAWAKLLGPDGLRKEGSLDGLRPGSPFQFATAAGDRLEGTIRNFVPGKTFSALVENLNKAILAIETTTMNGMNFLYLTLNTWGLPQGVVETQGPRLR
jgi:uncharacterized protein YndB with AHSA1/START domain